MTERTHTAKTVTLWILVGVAGLLSVAGILSIGVLTMPLVYAGAILLLVRPDRTRGVAVMVCALAVGPLLVARLNRDGPGQVCRSYPPDGVACGTQLNPWAWLGGAAGAPPEGRTQAPAPHEKHPWRHSSHARASVASPAVQPAHPMRANRFLESAICLPGGS